MLSVGEVVVVVVVVVVKMVVAGVGRQRGAATRHHLQG